MRITNTEKGTRFKEEDEKDLSMDSKIHCEGAHPLYGVFSWRGLDRIKLAYKPCQLDDRLRLTAAPLGKERKVYKSTDLYSAYRQYNSTTKRSDVDPQSYLQIHNICLSFV